MNFFSICGIFLLFAVGLGINSAYAQIDPSSDIEFFQTGEIQTVENQFLISNEFEIREFFNGNIIRVSGQTIEGFPYIIYSKVSDEKLDTFGKIFISGKFVNLIFNEINNNQESIPEQKQDNLSILVKYSQRVYSNQDILIQIKTFDPEINTKNDFTQNYGLIPNTDIQVNIIDDEGITIFSENGKSNENGSYETQFRVPVDKITTYTMKINSSNDSSESSKILQIIHAGADPTDK